MLQRIRNRKGFTLVELMIVVAIIGILAAIAIPNFLAFRLKAKTSEAKSNLGAIRSTEVAYFAEWNYFVGVQPATPLLNRAGSAIKLPWILSTRFSILGFAPEGLVYYSYELSSGAVLYPLGGANVTPEGLSMNAVGDLDGDSNLSTYFVNDINNEIVKVGAPF